MKRSQRSPRSFYRVGRIRYAAAVAAMVFSVGGFTAAATDVRADSPAARDQAVIAQGITTMPGEQAAWTVNLQSASSDGADEPVDSMTGFLVADQGSLLVTEGDGDMAILDSRSAEDGSAEALFVNGDDEQVRTAVADAARYFEIELVSGQAAESENVIGEAFEVPAGVREISMVQGDLNEGAATAFTTSEFPILMIAMAGELRVEQTDGVNGVLSAHEAVLLEPGERATVSGENGRVAYVAVFLGDELDQAGSTATATSVNTPIPTQEPAQPTVEPTVSVVVDTDGDGLSDEDEEILATDPNNPDSDGDGLEDGYEVYTSGTLPLVFDTDSDGLPDGDEIFTFGTNPSSPDTDGDAMDDYLEVIDFGTNPNSGDTDGDGINDYAEIDATFTNPLVFDTDDDGVGDGAEIDAGTNPNDPLSN